MESGERPGTVNREREGCALSSDEEMNVNPNPGLIQDASVLISSFTITSHQAPQPNTSRAPDLLGARNSAKKVYALHFYLNYKVLVGARYT